MQHTGRLQAVGLALLLLLALLGSIGPFAGVAAADQGSISFDDSTYADGDTVTVIVEDGDLSTTEEYVVNVQSETEAQETISNKDIEDGVTSLTTEHPVADVNGDNKITEYEIVYDNNADGSGSISSVSRNDNGTVDITLNSQSDSDDVIGYTIGETVSLSHEVNSRFSGTTKVSKSDVDGELQVSDGDTINATYSDESAAEDRIVNATIEEDSTDSDNDPGSLSLGPVTEFSTDSLDGTSLTHTESVIEIPFSEDVSAAGGASGNLTLGGNVTVAVDGENVTDRYVLDANGSADGQIVVTSATPVDPRAEVTVGIDAVNDSADTETIAPGTVDATVTDATVGEGSDGNAYDNETVAFVAAEQNRAFDVYNDSDAFVYTGRTGNGSQVYAFDTAARNWSGGYTIESTGSDGGVAATTDVTLRDLELSIDVEDRNITTVDGIDARISAIESGREVEAALVDADDTVVARQNTTLGGNGDATVEFGADRLAEAGPGNYTVTVTDAATGAAVDSDRIRVVDADERTASFRSNVVTEHAGDVAVLDLELRYADTATVTIGGPDVGFRANATVEDRDDDGSVRLRFNTVAAADTTNLPDDGGDVFTTTSGEGNTSGTADAVVDADIDDRHTVSETLDPAEYDLAVRPGSNASATETSVGTLVLRQPSPQRLDTWVAPADADFSSPAEVSAAVEAGRLTNASEIATGDVVVHRIVAPGIAGAIGSTSGNATEAFFGLAGSDDEDLYALNVTQRDPDPNEEPYRLRLNNTTARVVADATNDTYFVIYRSGAPDAVPWDGTAATGPADPDAPAVGDSLSAEFTVRADDPFADLARMERRVTATHSIVVARVAADGPIVVTNATNQSVTGTTTLAPGTEFDLRLRSDNGTEPRFLKTARAVVGPDGRWNATVDFDSQRVGDTFTVRSAVDTVAPANELAVDGEVRATLPQNTSTPTSTAQSTTTAAGGSGGGGADGGGDDGRDRDTPSPESTATATPAQSTDSGGSVVDSAQQYLGDVFGTAVDDTDTESIRDRLFDFDVAVAVAALVIVVIYVSRQG